MSDATSKYTLSTRDAAKLLSLSPKTVIKHVREGTLAAINVSASDTRPMFRFAPEDVERFLARRLKRGPALQRATPETRPGHRPNALKSLKRFAALEAGAGTPASHPGDAALREALAAALVVVRNLTQHLQLDDAELLELIRSTTTETEMETDND